MHVTAKQAARFWDKYIPEPNSGCWIWLGNDVKGYGRYRIGSSKDGTRAMAYANRVACHLTHGHVPEDMMALHKCDNKSCVNPDHLYIGDCSQNHRDAYERGLRNQFGERNPRAKLTQKQAEEIAVSGEPRKHLYNKYGVSLTTISDIKRGIRFLRTDK